MARGLQGGLRATRRPSRRSAGGGWWPRGSPVFRGMSGRRQTPAAHEDTSTTRVLDSPPTFRLRIDIDSGASPQEGADGPCAAMNSCSCSVRTRRTSESPRSSIARPARSPPTAARSSRWPRGAAGGSRIPSSGTARVPTTSSSSRRRAGTIAEIERTLLITEEVLRHLVVRQDRPAKALRQDGAEGLDETELPSVDDEEEDDGTERIDESESEAAPAAID